MPKDTPFAVTSRQLLDAWLATDPTKPASPADIFRKAADGLTIKTRLTILDTKNADPMAWPMRAARHYGFVSRVVNMKALLPDGPLGAVKDKAYLERSVIPQVLEAMETQQPRIELVKTKFFGVNVGYDRILLPQRTSGRPEWVVSCTYAQFLLNPSTTEATLDIAEEAIMQLLIEGATAKEIAETLDISHRTVEHKLGKMKQRFGARNIVHLAAMLLARHVGRLSHPAPPEPGTAKTRRDDAEPAALLEEP